MKIVIFKMASREYGVDIRQVREVIRMKEIIPVPESSEFVEGVISLRGAVVPVINMRKKFGLENKAREKTNRIIVTHINRQIVGVIVDEVMDVIYTEEGNIAPPDEVLKDAEYLTGVAKTAERLILMMDLEKILSGKEKMNIEKVQKRVEVRKKHG